MTQYNSLAIKTRYRGPSSWWQHIPIAHFLVCTLKPEIIVELGSHYGVSLFGFCEAAEQMKLSTHIYAIDTWSGDSQAGYYKDDVYNIVKGHRDEFHKQRCDLLRETFNDAEKYFGEGSIDILHIDGLHTYDAVKEDYDTWLPKLKCDGTILFHDINVRKDSFGVWKLWEEIKRKGEFRYIEIKSGHGLGILTMSNETPEWHAKLIEQIEVLKYKGLLLEELSEHVDKINQMKDEKVIREKHVRNLEIMMEAKKEEVSILQKELESRNKRRSKLYNIRNLLKKLKRKLFCF